MNICIARRVATVLLAISTTLGFAATEQGDFLLQCGKVLDVTARKLRGPSFILVAAGRIAAIGPAAEAPAGASVIDLRDRICAPGLIDVHTHLMGANDKGMVDYGNMSSAAKALMAGRNAEIMLNIGFTSARVPGDLDHHWAIVDLRDAIAAGEMPGPRLFVAPHLLTPTGGHNDERHGPKDIDQHAAPYVVAAGVDNAREAVRNEIRGGADWIKLTASGGVMSTGDDPRVQAFTDAELHAFAEETHRYGKKITAHIHGNDAAYVAAQAKFDSIEHGTMIDAKTIKAMKKSGTYLVPTLYVLDWILAQGVGDGITQEMLDKAIAVTKMRDIAFKAAYKAGVKIAFGTDQIFPHRESLEEFASLKTQGVSNWDAIAMATVNGADLLGKSDEFGSLSVGKLADIIAMPSDPVADTVAFKAVDFVMQAGSIVRNDVSPVAIAAGVATADRRALELLTDVSVMIAASPQQIWPYIVNPNAWKQGPKTSVVSGQRGQGGAVYKAALPESPDELLFYSRDVVVEANRRRTIKIYSATDSKLTGYATWTLEAVPGGTRVHYSVLSEFLMDGPLASITDQQLAAYESQSTKQNRARFEAELAALKKMVEL